MTIFNNILQLKQQMTLSGRQGVSLLAVSKAQAIDKIEEAIVADQLVFGENYVQEAVEKIKILNERYKNLEWHYIGKIQKNKIKIIAHYFDWVQTLDDEESAIKLNNACEKLNKKLQVCIQVNISDESQKNGVCADEINELSKYIVEHCPSLCLRGLMTIGLATEDQTLLKKMFFAMKQQFDMLKLNCTSVDTLSMGMSHDMVLALECGSTLVRIGSAIFGERKA